GARPAHGYGSPMGVPPAAIRRGEHVHSHNMRSLLSPAARQDLKPPVVRPAHWVRALVRNSLAAAGASPEAAVAMADAVTEAHLRGGETPRLRRCRPLGQRLPAGGGAPAA